MTIGTVLMSLGIALVLFALFMFICMVLRVHPAAMIIGLGIAFIATLIVHVVVF